MRKVPPIPPSKPFNKREYIKYLELVKPHLTEKCLIIADNITSHAEKVQDFIDAIDKDDEFQSSDLFDDFDDLDDLDSDDDEV